DFDGNGYDDLMVGVPLEDLAGGADGGAANVIYGSSAGLTSTGDQFWNQDKTTIKDKVEAGDTFATSLTTGDFNGDGYDDAAFGVPGEDLTNAVDGGAVNVIYGTSGGLSDPSNQYWKQSSTGILDDAEAGDIFGVAVAAADFGNDTQDDLAIGVQW